MEKINAANRPGKSDAERKRIPMSVPVSKLEAPNIPGYHLHWFNGTPDRIARAQAGGYEFVHENEVRVNSVGLGADSTASGNTDLGSQVSVVGGKELDGKGNPVRMLLMKIKQEWYEEDQKLVDQRNDKVAQSLAGGILGADQAQDRGDVHLRYVGASRTKIPDMFLKGAMAKKNRPPA